MKFPLSQNELIILDRQMSMVARHLGEIASLLESRLGTTDTAVSARTIQEGFTELARKIHNQALQVDENSSFAGKSQIA